MIRARHAVALLFAALAFAGDANPVDASPPPEVAVSPPPEQNLVQLHADSILLETCRGGRLSASGLTCSGATASPRVTVIRRHAQAIKLASAPATTVSLSTYNSRLHYKNASAYFTAPGVDTVTICPIIVDASGVKRLGRPAVRVKLAADSSTWTNRSGNPITQMCGYALEAERLSDTVGVPVTWSGVWFEYGGRRLFRPFPVVP